MVALLCQVLAGSFAPLSMTHAATGLSTAQAESPACHGDMQPAAGGHHPCGCDGSACKCPCMLAAAPTFSVNATAVPTPALAPSPADFPPAVHRANSPFRPPI